MAELRGDEWVSTTVEHIAAPGLRAIAIGPFGSALKAELYTAEGMPVLRGQDILEGRRLSDENLVYVPDEIANNFPACIVRTDDLVFPHRGAIGRVGIVASDREYLLSSSMMKLTCNATVVDPNYVFYYFRGPGRTELMARSSTVGTPGIGQPLRSLRSIPIRFPSLKVQTAIAEVLGSLDDKISGNERLATLADQLLAARFASLTEGRETSALSSIASVNVATAKPVTGGRLRYLDISSVRQGGYAYPEETSWDDAPGRARRVVRRFDTIWSTVRPNRRSHAFVLDHDPLLIASTGLAVLTPHSGRSAGLYEASGMPGFESFLLSVAEGSAYPAVRADRFAEAPIPALSDAEWDEFEAIALPTREFAHSAQVESRRLASTRDELLPLLMSGKVRIKEVEGVV